MTFREQFIECLPLRFREWCIRSVPEFGDVLNDVARISYSQQGEDLAVERYFRGREKGFYVDVGAFHPVKFSNTWKLYRKGWSGINIDANPEAIQAFHEMRPRDISINVGISESGKALQYTMFNEPTLNTFDSEHARLWADRDGFEIIASQEIQTQRLRSVMEEFMDPACTIDLMNVDVEGLDLQVLESNDWSRFRPELLLVEGRLTIDSAPATNDVVAFLMTQGYSLWELVGGTMLFRCQSAS